MSPLTILAVARVPQLARYLTGDAAAEIGAMIDSVVSRVANTTTAAEIEVACAYGTEAGTRLLVELGGLAEQFAATERHADLLALSDSIRLSTVAALQQAAPGGLTPASGRPVTIVSVTVLGGFVAVMAIVLVRGIPVGSETAANVLLGTLAAMATSVVSYWVGSSAGSARKEERLMQAAKPG